MTDWSGLLRFVGDGVLFGVQFNPMFALVTAALAAALWGYPKVTKQRRQWAAVVLAAGWLLGDGLRVLANARDYYDAGAMAPTGWPAYIIAWAIVSLTAGYVLPAVVGGVVGRRVTHGTGWLAAAAVAGALTVAVSRAAGIL